MLADNYEITVADLQQALQRQNLALQPGHEFAFVMQPQKLKGATGSTVAPIAIR
jgi:hypothetical protein